MVNFEDYLKDIGERIKVARGSRFKATIASAADVDPARYTRIESGTTNFTIETLVKLANALGVDPVELLPPKQTTETIEALVRIANTLGVESVQLLPKKKTSS